MADEYDLSLVPAEELFNELDKRFDHWVFAGMSIDNRIKDQLVTLRKWRGNAATCAGLASQLQIAIFEKHMETEKRGYPP